MDSYPSRYSAGNNPRRYPVGHMRVSDADRDAALAELSEHYQAGRLTTEEMEDRTAKALASKTGGELTSLLNDLPPAGVAVPKAPPPPRRRSGWAAAGTAALVLVAVAALTVGVVLGHDHHNIRFGLPWWIIPLVFIFLRRRTWGHRHHHQYRDSDHRIDRQQPNRTDPGELS